MEEDDDDDDDDFQKNFVCQVWRFVIKVFYWSDTVLEIVHLLIWLQKYILESGSESSGNSRYLCICAYYMKLAYISRSRFSMGINLMNLSLSQEFSSVVNTWTVQYRKSGFVPGLI